jgi:hypothetical protein
MLNTTESIYAYLNHHGTVTNAQLEALSKDPRIGARKAVAHSAQTPLNILDTLADDEAREVVSNVARNPNTHVATLMKLAKRKENHLSMIVALNPSSTVEILEELAETEHYLIKSRVITHDACSEKLLEKLSQDEVFLVRAKVAEDKKTPLHVLKRLAEEKDMEERLLYNSSLPLDMMLEISGRKVKGTHAVFWNLNATEECLDQVDLISLPDRYAEDILDAPKLSAKYLTKLLHHPEPDIVYEIMLKDQTPIGEILNLAVSEKNKDARTVLMKYKTDELLAYVKDNFDINVDELPQVLVFDMLGLT